MLNLFNYQQDIHKTYLYAKDLFEAKNKFLTNKHEAVDLKHYGDLKDFIEDSNDLQDDSNKIRTYNHLVHKRTLNSLAKLAKHHWLNG